ncbi:MAG: DNA-processing protein DprA [Candidatus Gastranaerophilales bacterium]|nr:DNA-processing protein DprA [Candidatus Gastranaerophilales bacterium]
MENLKYWIAFSSLDFIGSVFLTKVWNHFGCIKEAWFATNADFLEIEGLQYKAIQKFLEARKNVNPDQVLEEIIKRDVKVLTLEDKNYPYLLRQIYDPPAVLYIKGDLNICNLDKTLAVVGSRKASNGICGILTNIIRDLRGSDVTIVSGMALGVDTCSHKAAIDNNLKTIAVLGGGFDFIYPSKNKDLFKKISEGSGAVVSEYYPAERPDTWKFPHRNRIISGFSKGTLIAEAGLKSGALITARLCLEQNRELMCIPGQITNPNTEGIHKLIKEGAGLVTDVNDIFNHMNWHCITGSGRDKKNFKIDLLDNEEKIYEILKLESKTFDEILNESGFNIDNLMVTLTTLEIKGIIKQIPGQKYIKLV